MNHNKIFISQGTLNMGRNRSNRRLIARLDHQSKSYNPNVLSQCKYKNICPNNIPKYSMKCIFNKKDCKIGKYFKRFEGLDITKLGVGN